jgi:hypothetical protein
MYVRDVPEVQQMEPTALLEMLSNPALVII